MAEVGVAPGRNRRTSSGSAMIEATFVLMAFVAILFLMVDLCWGMFAKVALQNAVRAGVRYAVTSQQATGSSGQTLGQVASILQEVQQQSMGFLNSSNVGTYVSVCFYAPNTGAAPSSLGCGTTASTNANSGGNVVTVSVNSYPVYPMAPLYRKAAPVPITVSSSDLIESSGNNGTPPPL